MAGRYNSLTLQVSRFFKHSSYKQTINFFLTSITEKTGLKYNNLMVLNQCTESMSTLTKSMLIVTQSLPSFDETTIVKCFFQIHAPGKC